MRDKIRINNELVSKSDLKTNGNALNTKLSSKDMYLNLN